jgi:hypothetical protein
MTHSVAHVYVVMFCVEQVELFPWCGTNPWIFKNWYAVALHINPMSDCPYVLCCRWEDNWLTDIYLPFDSVFYQKGVVVENYVGLEPNEATSHVEGEAGDAATPASLSDCF